MDAFVTPPKTTQMGKSGKGVQTIINDAYKKELREKACVDIARWMYEVAIPFNAVNYDGSKLQFNQLDDMELVWKPQVTMKWEFLY